MSRIYLHVDRVVLSGLGPLDHRRVEAGLSAELTRLLAQGRPAAQGADRVTASMPALAAGAPAHAVGAAVARAVHGALTGSKRGRHG